MFSVISADRTVEPSELIRGLQVRLLQARGDRRCNRGRRRRHPQAAVVVSAALVIIPLVLLPLCELCVLVVVSACRHWSVMPKDTSNNNPELPFPGEYGPNGFAIQYICLGSLTNSELSEHCKTFKLAHSGNKTTLTSRLTEFSKDKSLWESLIPGATNAHKGTRKSEKKTKPKGSSLRRETLFNGAAGVRVLNAPVTERSKDLRTPEEKAAILPWNKAQRRF
ncbi:hypothetical protein DFH07DRAFT_838087 [Mycena maculata]|uniref:SAP domain-containing protein n=1 Tax=Mycena maculata TaxID=230809 RepID=A0AAD7IGI9_9AGAR|nr:hypothetical protein DFH07DRAFT_838087 [Mycena maculata]